MEKNLGSTEIERLSSLVFGRAIRLPLHAWVRKQTGPFFQRQAADGVGTHQTYIRTELTTLVETGMLDQLPRSDGDNRVFYSPNVDHPWWKIIDAAVEALAATEGRK
ncbi:hypothetical protein D5S17_35550 [Pseudonocardiaceae bacterium YIM PH 21723]|nr:hypothetical protein D5S17_35550 [Pseudonocardiaceae bacterium YIM PH 21723]